MSKRMRTLQIFLLFIFFFLILNSLSTMSNLPRFLETKENKHEPRPDIDGIDSRIRDTNLYVPSG